MQISRFLTKKKKKKTYFNRHIYILTPFNAINMKTGGFMHSCISRQHNFHLSILSFVNSGTWRGLLIYRGYIYNVFFNLTFFNYLIQQQNHCLLTIYKNDVCFSTCVFPIFGHFRKLEKHLQVMSEMS